MSASAGHRVNNLLTFSQKGHTGARCSGDFLARRPVCVDRSRRVSHLHAVQLRHCSTVQLSRSSGAHSVAFAQHACHKQQGSQALQALIATCTQLQCETRGAVVHVQEPKEQRPGTVNPPITRRILPFLSGSRRIMLVPLPALPTNSAPQKIQRCRPSFAHNRDNLNLLLATC